MNKLCLFYSSTLSNKIIYYNFIKKNPNFFNEVIEFPLIQNDKSIIFKRIFSSGFKFVFFQFIINYYYKFFNYLLGNKISKLCHDHNIKYYYFTNLNSELLKKLKKDKYDLIFNGQTSIIRRNIFNSLKTKFINCHCAPLPNFRGVANYIWLLLNNSKCYSTLHFVDDTIDGGKIIDFSKKISINKFNSVFSLWLKMRILGMQCIKKNKNNFLNNKKILTIKIKKISTIRSFPKANEIKKLKVPFFKLSDLIFILLEPFKK
jgi:folate-dependent phosphoribosylglycinamide formyltransferase PurN